MPRSDSAFRDLVAPPQEVYAALVDRESLETWLPPEGMIGRIEHFDPRPGGSYRIVLTYADRTTSQGKSTPDSDIAEARFIELVPSERVVWAVDFVSDDPAYAGTMTMTWSLDPADGGTRVGITADNVPDALSAEDHAAGMASSLANLAGFLGEG